MACQLTTLYQQFLVFLIQTKKYLHRSIQRAQFVTYAKFYYNSLQTHKHMGPQTCSFFFYKEIPLSWPTSFWKKNGWGPIFSRLDSTPVTSPVYVPPWEVTSGKARGLLFLNSGKFEPTYVRNSYETFTAYDIINQAVVHLRVFINSGISV